MEPSPPSPPSPLASKQGPCRQFFRHGESLEKFPFRFFGLGVRPLPGRAVCPAGPGSTVFRRLAISDGWRPSAPETETELETRDTGAALCRLAKN
jgi:hypothetical protein